MRQHGLYQDGGYSKCANRHCDDASESYYGGYCSSECRTRESEAAKSEARLARVESRLSQSDSDDYKPSAEDIRAFNKEWLHRVLGACWAGFLTVVIAVVSIAIGPDKSGPAMWMVGAFMLTSLALGGVAFLPILFEKGARHYIYSAFMPYLMIMSILHCINILTITKSPAVITVSIFIVFWFNVICVKVFKKNTKWGDDNS